MARESTLRGPQAPTARQRARGRLEDIADVGERVAQPKRAHEAAEAGKQRVHEGGLQKSAEKAAFARTLADRGVVQRGQGPAKTEHQKHLARKKTRQKQLGKLRARQAFEERTAQIAVKKDPTKARKGTFAAGAPIRIQTRKGGPTLEFTRGLIERGGAPLKQAQRGLRSEAAAARQDFDITTGRGAIERLSSRDEAVRDVSRGLGGDRPTPSQQRRQDAIGNVEGSAELQRVLADARRGQLAQEAQSAQVEAARAPAQPAQPAQVAQAPAAVAPVAPVPAVAPVTSVPTQGSTSTGIPPVDDAGQTILPVAGGIADQQRQLISSQRGVEQQQLAGSAVPQQGQNLLGENDVNVILADPNLQSFFPSMAPQQQQQILGELERRLQESRGLQQPQVAPPVAQAPAPLAQAPPPAFARPFAIPEVVERFGTGPGETPPPRPDLSIRGAEPGQGGFQALPESSTERLQRLGFEEERRRSQFQQDLVTDPPPGTEAFVFRLQSDVDQFSNVLVPSIDGLVSREEWLGLQAVNNAVRNADAGAKTPNQQLRISTALRQSGLAERLRDTLANLDDRSERGTQTRELLTSLIERILGPGSALRFNTGASNVPRGTPAPIGTPSTPGFSIAPGVTLRGT